MYLSARISTVFLFVVVLKAIRSLPSDDRDREDTMQQLYLRIADLQAKQTRGILPPLHWATERGAYKSTVRINTHGKPWISTFRQIGCYDNNAFTTLWVTVCLLEARRYGRGAPELDEEQMKLALELISSHHDKNHPAGTGVVDFWPQIWNKSSGMWVSQPDNLVPVIDILDEIVPWKQLEEICKRLGPAVKEGCTLVNLFANAKSQVMPFFKIPPDFDDSFLNIGLGSLLKHNRKQPPGDLYQLWASYNTKADSLFGLLKTYAYRPLSSSLASVIDPRTYYYLRGFVEKAKSDGKDVALATTWMQNLTEERVRGPRGVSMPFHLNNVDTTVAANVVYGITAALLENLFDTTTWFDDEVLMIYENTTSLIEWLIESGTVSTRPDLALTYYPSRYNFYWFVSRTRFLLANRIASGGLPVNIPSLRFVYERLNTILQTRVTFDLLSEAKTEGGTWAYFDDFLGGGDETWEGQATNNAEDRLFSTAMAVNTLIATWTTHNVTSARLLWSKETPVEVIHVVQQAVAWLETFILRHEYEPLNAFFSGSVKGDTTSPFFYPINFAEYLNGTKIPLNTTRYDGLEVLGMKGVMTEAQYNILIQEKHFGHKTPTEFPGYNDYTFPFWSSVSYTYSSALLAVSQFMNLAKG